MLSWRRSAALLVTLALAVSLSPWLGSAPAQAATLWMPSIASVDDLDSDGDGAFDRPNASSASVAAQSAGERVEDLSRRTPTTQVFANADGTWTTEATAGPVRAQDPATGEWDSIDTALVLSDESPLLSTESWHPKSAVGGMTFSNGGSGPMVTMTGEDAGDLTWSWPDTLPAPGVVGNTLTYADVVPHGDLVVEALAGGFSYSVVLREAPTADFKLPILIDSGEARLTKSAKDGSLLISGDDGEIVSAPEPLMWDNAEASDRGDTSRSIATKVTTTADGARLVLMPDMDFLSHPDTEYPVTIDPTFSVSAGSFVNYMDPFYERDGQVDYNILIGEVESNSFYRSVLGFGGTELQAGGVTSATLSLYADYATSCTPSSVTVQRVISAEGADWNTQPQFQPVGTTVGQATVSQTAKGGSSGCSAPGWDTWDITSIAQAWGNNGAANLGLIVTSDDGVFRSYVAPGNGSLSPKISVTSSGGSGAPLTPGIATITPVTYFTSPNLEYIQYTSTLTPTFASGVPNNGGTSTQVFFEARSAASASSTLLASCETAYAAQGSQVSCASSGLPNNTTAYVRAKGRDTAGTWGGGSKTSEDGWSSWVQLRVATTTPAAPVIDCGANYPNGASGIVSPGAPLHCKITATGLSHSAPGYILWRIDGGPENRTHIQQSADPSIATWYVDLPTSAGYHNIIARAESPSGLISSTRAYSIEFANMAIPPDSAGGADGPIVLISPTAFYDTRPASVPALAPGETRRISLAATGITHLDQVDRIAAHLQVWNWSGSGQLVVYDGDFAAPTVPSISYSSTDSASLGKLAAMELDVSVSDSTITIKNTGSSAVDVGLTALGYYRFPDDPDPTELDENYDAVSQITELQEQDAQPSGLTVASADGFTVAPVQAPEAAPVCRTASSSISASDPQGVEMCVKTEQVSSADAAAELQSAGLESDIFCTVKDSIWHYNNRTIACINYRQKITLHPPNQPLVNNGTAVIYIVVGIFTEPKTGEQKVKVQYLLAKRTGESTHTLRVYGTVLCSANCDFGAKKGADFWGCLSDINDCALQSKTPIISRTSYSDLAARTAKTQHGTTMTHTLRMSLEVQSIYGATSGGIGLPNSPTIRCDTLWYVSNAFSPGCVFSGSIPRFNESRTQPTSDPSTQSADFVNWAQGEFPQNNNYWGREADGKPLTRHYYFGETNKNRNRAKKLCRKIYGSRPNQYVDCDEYPFSSTYQGCFDNHHPQYGESIYDACRVRYLSSAHNQALGRRLGRFFTDYRVMNEDRFWTKIKP